ncbi:MAG: 1,6-anhydro-N-acetylmuramyl-L-alanine amidase AmpD [Oxalobacter sp.]|nr:MAG: 1,6-anhydro-N-acetylmuramyl-L-alanine amidase AmpD [Oxalobacter sp.]
MSLASSGWHIDAHGWCPQAEQRPSPNCDARPTDVPISLLVIHNISLPPGQFGGSYIDDLFLNCLNCDAHPYFEQLRDLHVSAHFLIRRQGEVTQFVSTLSRAWHAGVSSFLDRERCNDFSIGVELEGTDGEAFTVLQYESLTALTHALMGRHPLTDVVGHEHIAPARKTDPGPFFDWRFFHSLLSTRVAPSKLSLLFPGT